MTIKIFFQKHWATLLWLAIIIFLASVLFQQCSGSNEMQAELTKLNKENAELATKLKKSEEKHRKDSLSAANNISRQDTIISDLYSQLQKTNSDYKVTQQKSNYYLRQAQDLSKKLTDSIGLLVAQKIDSAATEFDNLSLKYASLEYKVTQLTEAIQQKDSIRIAQLKIAYDEAATLRDAYMNILSKYNIVQSQYSAVLKKVKRRGFLNRIFAGVALGSIIYGTLK